MNLEQALHTTVEYNQDFLSYEKLNHFLDDIYPCGTLIRIIFVALLFWRGCRELYSNHCGT